MFPKCLTNEKYMSTMRHFFPRESRDFFEMGNGRIKSCPEVREYMPVWKRILWMIAVLQVGSGIAIIGVVSFIPLFLTSELGVADAGEAAFLSGIISGITPFFVAFATPFWAVQANRFGHKTILLILTAILGFVVFWMYFARTPTELLILRILQGVSGGAGAVAMATVMNATPKDKLPWALGVFQASMVMGFMFGPLAGGVIADLFGYRMPFLVFGMITMLCLVGAFVFLPNQETENGKRPESLWSNVGYFFGNPVVCLMVMLQFLCNVGLTGIGPILPLYIKGMMGGDAMAVASVVGAIIFIAGGTSVCASLTVPRLTEHFSMTNIIFCAVFVTGVNFILQYLMPTVTLLGMMRGLVGLSFGVVMPIANTILAAAVPAERRTVILGLAQSFALMGNVVGPFASGAIAMQFGYASVFWSTAVCLFAAAAVIHMRRYLIESQMRPVRKG